SARVESSDSLMNKLMTDEGMGPRAGRDLESIVHYLTSVAAKPARGNGSAAKLINDPSIYDAVNDVIVGVKESKMLRWLIRNRQKKGIATRYNAAVKELGAQGAKEGEPAPEPGAQAEPTASPAADRAPPPAEPTPTPPGAA